MPITNREHKMASVRIQRIRRAQVSSFLKTASQYSILLLLTLILGACSGAKYRYEPLESFDFVARAESQNSEFFDVRAAILSGDESEALFGIPTRDRDVQAIWLEVTNRDEDQGRIALSSIDPKYFPPAEVAYFFKGKFSREGWMALEKRLIDMALPRFVPAGETVSGFVFTNYTQGTKAFNLDVYLGSLPPSFEQFSFFLAEPGFQPDYAAVRFRDLYSEEETIRVDTEGLQQVLEDLDCCTRNRDGSERGRPVNIFVISEPYNLLRALLRAGWLETARSDAPDGDESKQYLFGRPADSVSRKPRDKTTDRAELMAWKTPVIVDGKSMWAFQLKHTIGRRFPIGERFFGVHVDPDTVDGRDYVLQDLWYAQAIEQWAFSSTGIQVPRDAPESDFQGNAWFSHDPRRVVIWVAPTPVAMTEATQFKWPENAGPEEQRR